MFAAPPEMETSSSSDQVQSGLNRHRPDCRRIRCHEIQPWLNWGIQKRPGFPLKSVPSASHSLWNVRSPDFNKMSRVYTMKKDIVILERLGTLTLLGLLQSSLKIATCTGFFYLLSLFTSIEECLLLSISLFASENFHTINLIQEQQSSSNDENPVSNLARQKLQGK